MIEGLEAKVWLELNAKLQKKKNTLRKVLKEKGVLKKGAVNKYDNYTYFSEAQYKELFTGLFADCGLELKFNEISYETFTGTEKRANGRMPKLEFELMDIDTGFGETTSITGEGIDSGDKAGYKAYTGAVKYYLANTFLVATGDDAEKDSPSEKMNDKQITDLDAPITEKQLELIKKIAEKDGKTLNDEEMRKWTKKQASDFIEKCKGGNKQ